MRPKPLIPTRTVMTPPCRSMDPSPAGRDYSRACRASASFTGSCANPSGRATAAAHRLDAPAPGSRPRRRPGSRLPDRGSGPPGPRVPAPPAGGPTRRARWSRAPAGRRLQTWTTRPGAAASAVPELGHADHRQQARVERPGRQHDLVGLADRRRARRHTPGASFGMSPTRRIRPAEFCTATWPSTASPSMSAFSTTGSVVAGSTRPTASSSRPASSSARQKSPSVSVSPTIIRLPSACPSRSPAREPVLERLGPHRRVTGQRDEALAQVARAPARRSRGAAGRSSRRRRRRSPPR